MMKMGMGIMAFVGTTAVAFASVGQESAELGASTALEPAAQNATATGLMIQARMQTQLNLLSVGGGSSFLIGYRGSSFGVGLGLGLMRVGGKVDDDKVSASVMYAMPTGLFDVWQSADGRARANIVAGIGYGKGTVKQEYTWEDCSYDPATGLDTCSTSKDEGTASASVVPIMVGLGGDYFLSRNFALGAEAGLQGGFVFGVKSEYEGESEDIDASGNMQLTYGVIRATFVLGN